MSMSTSDAASKSALHVKIELYDRRALRLLLDHPDVRPECKAMLLKYPRPGADTREVGELTVRYKRAAKGETKDDGRVYADKGSQMMDLEVRAELSHKLYHDIDIVNAHPTLILSEARRENWACEKLAKYVEDRDGTLARIQEYYGVERPEAKRLCCLLMFGGGLKNWEVDCKATERDMPEMLALKREFKGLMRHVWEKYPKRTVFPPKSTDRDKMATNMSAWVCGHEYSTLMVMHAVAIEMGESPDVLIHDGMMIRKRPALDEERLSTVMRAMEARVLEKLGYEIKLVEKVMEPLRTLDMSKAMALEQKEAPADMLPPDVLVNDRYAARKLVELAGGRLKSVDGELYSYVRGLWSKDPHEVDKLIEEFADRMVIKQDGGKVMITYDYVGSSRLLNAMKSRLAVQCCDDGFFDRHHGSGLGKLLFEDGVYDFETDMFTPGFDDKLLMWYRIRRPYCASVSPDAKAFVLAVIDRMFPDEDWRSEGDRDCGEYDREAYKLHMLICLARALAGGYANGRRFHFMPGGSGAGKSLLIAILMAALDGYVGTFTANSLRLPGRGCGADPAARNRFLVDLAHRRIALSTEAEDSPGMLDSGLIKGISGNDPIPMRQLYKEARSIPLDCTMFVFVNDVPEVSNFDKSMADRVRTIEFKTAFVEVLSDPPIKHERLRDKTLQRRFETEVELQDAVIEILRDAYRHFKAHGHHEPKMVTAATKDWVGEDASFVSRFEKLYERSEDRDDFVSADDVRSAFLTKYDSKHSTKWISQSITREVSWAEYDRYCGAKAKGYVRGFRFIALK
jgi:hypothetical protein